MHLILRQHRNNTKTIGKHGKLSKTTLQVHISTSGLVHLWSKKVCHMYHHSCWKFPPAIRCLVIAFLLPIHYVSLWPWPLTFWSWSVVIHDGVTYSTPPPSWRSYGYLFLSYKFWYCPWHTTENAFADTVHAISRDLCIGANFSHIFEIADPYLPIHWATCMAVWLR